MDTLPDYNYAKVAEKLARNIKKNRRNRVCVPNEKSSSET
jgi:hypothetical protein